MNFAMKQAASDSEIRTEYCKHLYNEICSANSNQNAIASKVQGVNEQYFMKMEEGEIGQ